MQCSNCRACLCKYPHLNPEEISCNMFLLVQKICGYIGIIFPRTFISKSIIRREPIMVPSSSKQPRYLPSSGLTSSPGILSSNACGVLDGNAVCTFLLSCSTSAGSTKRISIFFLPLTIQFSAPYHSIHMHPLYHFRTK